LSIHRRETCCFAWRSRCSTSPPARREWRLFLLQDTFFVVVLVTCVGNDFFLFSPSLSLSLSLSLRVWCVCVACAPYGWPPASVLYIYKIWRHYI
jgi:hypothetical protein